MKAIRTFHFIPMPIIAIIFSFSASTASFGDALTDMQVNCQGILKTDSRGGPTRDFYIKIGNLRRKVTILDNDVYASWHNRVVHKNEIEVSIDSGRTPLPMTKGLKKFKS